MSATVGVLIVNYRTPALALAALASVAAERSALPSLRAVLVDGGSGDGSADILAEGIAASGHGDWATLLPLPVNGGFGYANNQAILLLAEQGLPDYLMLLNPDARLRPGALGELVRFLDDHPRVAVAGGLLEHDNGERQGSAFHFPSVRGELIRGARTGVVSRLLGDRPPVVATEPVRVDWVTGAAAMFRSAALRDVGLFDDGFFLYFEETELAVRLARAGWQSWHVPAARVVHLAGRATQIRDPETGNMLAKRLPRYWYEARRRYFVRTHGAGGAIAAGLAWLAGDLLWQTRRIVTRRRDSNPERSWRDFVAFSLWPSRADRAADLPTLQSSRGATPAWMRAQSRD